MSNVSSIVVCIVKGVCVRTPKKTFPTVGAVGLWRVTEMNVQFL